MRPTRALAVTLAAGLALPVAGQAATYNSSQTGDWSNPATWGGALVPGAGDTVNVRNGKTVTLTSATQVDTITVSPGSELKLAGNPLTVGDTLEINKSGTPAGKVTSSTTATITVGKSLDLADAAITGADVTVTPGLSGRVTLWGHASITGTLTISGEGTVTFRPTTVNDATPVLSVGTLTRTGSPLATGELDWSLLQPPETTADPARGDQANLMSATGTLNGFTVPSASTHTVSATNTSVTASFLTALGTTGPVNTAVPTITGPTPPHPGDTLTCNPGTWIDADTFVYTWIRNDVDVSPGSATYTVTDADLGTSLVCRVTGIGNSGTGNASSASTAKITQRAPANTAAPALSAPSPARAGDAISCSQGTWNGAAGYTYAWTRDGVAIAGQSAATYTATTADAGHAITCTVTATSPHGSTTLTATAVSVSALPDTTALLAKASGTGWKTAGTADKLGVYTLPLTPVDGWAVNCESLTPGGKAIDTIVGKIGCTKDAITLVPLYPTKGENTWKGELTLTHGAASIKASINLTTTADQIPPADAAPPPLDAPKLNADGTITCPTGSSVTNLSTGTITQKQPATFWDKFVLHFTGPGNGNYTPPTDDPNQQLAKRGP